jgi:hypothetical protein
MGDAIARQVAHRDQGAALIKQVDLAVVLGFASRREAIETIRQTA